MITLDGNQHFTENKTFGDAYDVATANTYAQNMVIVKVNGDLEIDEGVTVAPYYDKSYGGPKGFTLYVTGKLTNKGTIDNSHGAKAVGQNVYLWKNTDGSYEYVPAIGATGGSKVQNASNGVKGASGTGRQTGGGGSARNNCTNCGPIAAGGTGTSYSGGVGSGTQYNAPEVSKDGGMGGAPDGAGNPTNGTGGLLTIYANEYENKGTIKVTGSIGSSNLSRWRFRWRFD